MKLTQEQWTSLTKAAPKLAGIKLDGTTDYQQISKAISPALLKAIANKTGNTQNTVIWAIRDYIDNSNELSKAEEEVLEAF